MVPQEPYDIPALTKALAALIFILGVLVCFLFECLARIEKRLRDLEDKGDR